MSFVRLWIQPGVSVDAVRRVVSTSATGSFTRGLKRRHTAASVYDHSWSTVTLMGYSEVHHCSLSQVPLGWFSTFPFVRPPLKKKQKKKRLNLPTKSCDTIQIFYTGGLRAGGLQSLGAVVGTICEAF